MWFFCFFGAFDIRFRDVIIAAELQHVARLAQVRGPPLPESETKRQPVRSKGSRIGLRSCNRESFFEYAVSFSAILRHQAVCKVVLFTTIDIWAKFYVRANTYESCLAANSTYKPTPFF